MKYVIEMICDIKINTSTMMLSNSRCFGVAFYENYF